MLRMLRRVSYVALALALAVAVGGCKKKSGEGGKAEGAATVKADVGSVAFPKDILAFGGAKSLDDLTTGLSGLVGKFQPQMAAMVAAQVPAMLQGQLLGVKSLAWLDTKKPIRFVILDYKQYGNPALLVLPHKGKDGLVAALPDTKAAGAPDNETTWKSPMGQDLFLNVQDDVAVVSFHPKAFGVAKAFLGGDFAKYEVTELLDVQASVTNLVQIAGPEIEAAKAQLAQAAAAPSPLPMPGMDKILQEEVAMLLDLLYQSEVARVVMRYDGDTVVLRGGLKVVDGKGLAKFAAGVKDRKLELYKGLPAGGWLVAAGNVDPMLFEAWGKLGMETWAGILKLDAGEKAKLLGLMAQAMALQTGDSAFSISRDGDFPFRILTVAGVKDGEKAKSVTYETYGMLFSKLGVLVEQFSGPNARNMPKLDWTSLKSFLDGLKPVLAQTGISAAIRSETAGGVAVDAVELGVDYAKVPGLATSSEGAMVQKVVGNKMSFGMGFDKGRMYGAFGKDAVADIAAVAKGGGTGAPLADAIAKYGTDTTPALAIYLSFVELMKIVAFFEPSVSMAMPGLATVQGDVGFAFIAGGHGDRAVDAILTVPVAKIATLMPKQGGMGGAPMAPTP